MPKKEYDELIKATEILGDNVSLGIAVFSIDERLQLVNANDYFFQMFGTCFDDYRDGIFCRFGSTDRIMYENYIKERTLERDQVTFEFKVTRKDSDSVFWCNVDAKYLCDKGKHPLYVATISDVTRLKNVENELNEFKNLYLKAISSGDEIIFDYKVKDDIFIYYKLEDENGTIVNKPNVRAKFLENLGKSRDVYPDDLVYFYDLCRENISHPFDVRFRRTKQKPGEYTKMRVHATVQKDDGGRPARIIGTIRPLETIDNKQARKASFDKVDELTGINSRSMAKKQIEEYLLNSSVDSPYALLILDIKGFKSVNDQFGHMFGDNVLIQVADCVIETINKSDIVGRLGGDEFIIFLKNVSENAVMAMSDRIRRAIKNVYVGEDTSIDACIGAVVATSHSITYQELLQTADNVLFDVITGGDGGIKITKDIISVNQQLKISYVADRNIRSAPNVKEKRLSELIFELLEQAKDMDRAMDTVLALVGEKKNLSRITILRRDGSKLYVTRQWVSRGIQHMEDIPTEAFNRFQKTMSANFCEDGMGVIDKHSLKRFDPDTAMSALETGAKSIMYCNMMEYGEVVGVIAFADCVHEREWTDVDYKAYRTITRMISAYTLKTEVFKYDNKESSD